MSFASFELARKGVHLVGGLIPLIYLFLDFTKLEALLILDAFCDLSLFLLLLPIPGARSRSMRSSCHYRVLPSVIQPKKQPERFHLPELRL